MQHAATTMTVIAVAIWITSQPAGQIPAPPVSLHRSFPRLHLKGRGVARPMVPSPAGPVGRNEAFSASVLPRPHALAEPGRRALLRDAAGPESGTVRCVEGGGRWCGMPWWDCSLWHMGS